MLFHLSFFSQKINLISMQHIVSRRHQKFANNDGNFIELDLVLNRVKRQTYDDARVQLTTYRHEEFDASEHTFIEENTIMGQTPAYFDDEDEDELILSPRKKRPNQHWEEYEDYEMA